MTSWSHRNTNKVSQSVTQWPHDGNAKTSRRRVAFLIPSASFLCQSYCHREEKIFDKARSKDDGHSNQQDVHRKSTRRCISGKTFGNFFDMPETLWTPPDLLPNPKNLTWRSHDSIGWSPKWPDVFTIIPNVTNFLHCVSIASQNRDSVTRA